MSDSKNQWIIKQENNKVIGPYSTQAVLNLISNGSLKGGEQIAQYPGGNWIPISQEADFYDRLLNVLESGATKITDLRKYDQETVITPPKQVNKDQKNRDQEKDKEKKDSILADLDFNNLDLRNRGTKSGTNEDTKTIGTSVTNIINMPVVPRATESSRNQSESVGKPVINLVNEKVIQRDEKEKQKVFLKVVIAGAILFFIYAMFFQEETQDLTGKIRLLVPGKAEEKLSQEDEKGLYKQVLGLIVEDNFSSYVEAQNNLVTLAESNPKETKYHELLCLVYKELWPYAFQDNEDLRTINQVGIFSKTINPTGRHGKSCEFVRLVVSGRFQEAKSQADALLSLESEGADNPWVPYWFKIDLLLSEKNYIQAEGYAKTLSTTWPYLARGHIYLAEAMNEINNPSGALSELSQSLKISPNNKVAKIHSGIIFYKKFNQADKSLNILSAAFSSDERAPRMLEGKGLFTLAEIYRQRGEKEKALKVAKRAYRANPSDQEIKTMITQLGGAASLSEEKPGKAEMVYMGDHYMRLGDCMSAQAEYKAAFDADPTNALAATRAAKCLWQINQSLEAIEYLKKAIKTDSKYLPAYTLLADYYSQRFDFDAALKLLNIAKALASDNFEVVRAFAWLEHRRNNNQIAVNYAKMAEKIYGADAETQIVLSKAYLALQSVDSNNVKEAFKSATRAVELDSISPDANIAYAETLYHIQGTEAAVGYLEALVNKNPFVYEYRLGLADMLKKEDRFKSAYEFYLQVLSLNERNKKAKIGVGEALQGLGQMDAALSAYLNAATIDPTDPEAIMKAGLLYLETGRFGPAIQQFERVIKINRFYPRANYFIGRAALLQGNLDKALEYSEAEKRQNPGMADPYVLAAEVYTQSKQFTKCAEEYQSAIKIRPQKAEIYIKIARCYRLSGSLDVAEAMLNIAESRESGSPDLYKERGLLYQIQNMNREAVTAFNKYLALSPNAPDRGEIENQIQRMGGTVE